MAGDLLILTAVSHTVSGRIILGQSKNRTIYIDDACRRDNEAMRQWRISSWHDRNPPTG